MRSIIHSTWDEILYNLQFSLETALWFMTPNRKKAPRCIKRLMSASWCTAGLITVDSWGKSNQMPLKIDTCVQHQQRIDTVELITISTRCASNYYSSPEGIMDDKTNHALNKQK